MSLTLPPEYTEVNRPLAVITYEIRTCPPHSSEDEAMAIVTKEKDKFLVEYWPEGATNWERYVLVNDLEEAKEVCKAIVMMGLSSFLSPKER